MRKCGSKYFSSSVDVGFTGLFGGTGILISVSTAALKYANKY
jgi:hypothetical protein